MTTLLPPLATSGPSLDWYLTRSTGAVALLLLSVAVALGVADVRRFSTPSWPRFVVDALHRNVSLLALLFLGLHIFTAVLDSFASISLVAAFVPFVGSYRPFWLGLGAVAFDLLLAVILTSLLRARVGPRAWRATHWLVYACWPVALLHTLGTGSDVKTTWLLALSVFCLALVLASVLARVLAQTGTDWGDTRSARIPKSASAKGACHPASVGWSRDSARGRSLAIGGAFAFALGLVLWLPSGPLGSEWARRSGTPSTLIETGIRAAGERHPASVGHPSASRSKIVVSP
jgi:sulfoxide reductase heme-binding subunit YedZ